jgi:hypothetical protein
LLAVFIFTIPCCLSAELFFSCCASVAALPALANCNEHVAKTSVTGSHSPTHSALCTASTARRLEWLNYFNFPFGIHARAPPAFHVSRAELPCGVS